MSGYTVPHPSPRPGPPRGNGQRRPAGTASPRSPDGRSSAAPSFRRAHGAVGPVRLPRRRPLHAGLRPAPGGQLRRPGRFAPLKAWVTLHLFGVSLPAAAVGGAGRRRHGDVGGLTAREFGGTPAGPGAGRGSRLAAVMPVVLGGDHSPTPRPTRSGLPPGWAWSPCGSGGPVIRWWLARGAITGHRRGRQPPRRDPRRRLHDLRAGDSGGPAAGRLLVVRSAAPPSRPPLAGPSPLVAGDARVGDHRDGALAQHRERRPGPNMSPGSPGRSASGPGDDPGSGWSGCGSCGALAPTPVAGGGRLRLRRSCSSSTRSPPARRRTT